MEHYGLISNPLFVPKTQRTFEDMPGEISFSIHDEYTGVPIVESDESQEEDGNEPVYEDNEEGVVNESKTVEKLDEDNNVKETVNEDNTKDNKDKKSDENDDSWIIW